MKRLTRLMLTLALLPSGCRGVMVTSRPSGADVFVDGEFIGRTPCKFRAWRVVGTEYEVSVREEGYRSETTVIDSEFPWGKLWLVLFPPALVFVPFFGTLNPPEVHAELDVYPGPWADWPRPGPGDLPPMKPDASSDAKGDEARR